MLTSDREDTNYAFPYLTLKTRRVLHSQIVSYGFLPDDFLKSKAPTFGINIAMSFPLPQEMKSRYELFSHEIVSEKDIAGCAFLYPFHTTHVTIATLVNFKNHFKPVAGDRKRILETASHVKELLAGWLNKMIESGKMKPFIIEIGPPVLSARTAFLPIRNVTDEIKKIRAWAKRNLKRLLDDDFNIPNYIHSTIMRFTKSPGISPALFLHKFEKIASHVNFGTVHINELYITSETRPYMQSGEILFTFNLQKMNTNGKNG
jgi:hypothetical protein